MDGITSPTHFRYTARSKTLFCHCGFRIKLLLQPNLAPSDSKHHPWTSISITWRLGQAQSLHWTSWIRMCPLRRSLDSLYISFLRLPYQTHTHTHTHTERKWLKPQTLISHSSGVPRSRCQNDWLPLRLLFLAVTAGSRLVSSRGLFSVHMHSWCYPNLPFL